jgi:cyclopropane fatty-acyl-phospholipid synthase-like methyltransferase
MDPTSYAQFENLTYDDFRRLATDPSLSCHEKIGFPDSYRAGKEEAILRDILAKLTPLGRRGQFVLDVGPGCGPLALRLIDYCGERGHSLVLVDSREMLDQLPDRSHLRKYATRFPRCPELLAEYTGRVQAVLVYSVLHYIFAEGNLFDFMDSALALLAPGGALLLGDIPNVSKRKRFFSSDAGAEYHRQFTGRDETPAVAFNRPEPGKFDDAVILALVARCRAAGFDAYVVPQGADLPMANRREDLLVTRP